MQNTINKAIMHYKKGGAILERLLTIKEVSEMLGYTQDPQCRFVRSLRKKGLLIGAKFGNRLMFKRDDVEEFIEKQFAIQNRGANYENKL